MFNSPAAEQEKTGCSVLLNGGRGMEYTIGKKVLDGWEIVRPIGAGSYGKVYEVKKTSYGVETVSALKVIRIPESPAEIRSALNDGMDEQSVTGYFKGFVDEILHEIAIMSAVKSHPNIVSYEDHHLEEYPGEIRWDILIRMEFLAPLDHYLQDKARRSEASLGGLPMSEVVRLGREIGSALAFCQRKNIIHRDIKPENIFISEAGQFKLGDFGVAKTAASRSTGGSHKGTERYMAPEVFLNQPYGSSVDIYSLGLVMYRLLNGGRLPFLPPAPKPLSFGDYENAQIRRMQGVPIPPPAKADASLASIILKACAFRSADRFRSAAELVEALDTYVKSHPEGEPSAFIEDLPVQFQEGPFAVGWRSQEPEAARRPEEVQPSEAAPERVTEESLGNAASQGRQDRTVGGWRPDENQEQTVGGWNGSGRAEGTVAGWNNRNQNAGGIQNKINGEQTAAYSETQRMVMGSGIMKAEPASGRKQSNAVNWPLVLTVLAAQIFCGSVAHYNILQMSFGHVDVIMTLGPISVTDMLLRYCAANGILAGLLSYIFVYQSRKTAAWTFAGMAAGTLISTYLMTAWKGIGLTFSGFVIDLLPCGVCLVETVLMTGKIRSKRKLLCISSGCYMAVYSLGYFM